MKICLLNDTRSCHSGSLKVMENIYHLFKDHQVFNGDVESTDDYDWLVVNGEGTIHHEADKAVRLLERALEAKENGKKIALINTVWQNMSRRWDIEMDKFDIIIARELFSYEQLYRLNRRTEVFPDFSVLFLGEGRRSVELSGVIKSKLHWEMEYLKPFDSYDVPTYSIDDGRTFEDQIEELKYVDLYLTGQHHGVYASILAGTPFIPTYGNTHKVESFLRWANSNIKVCKTRDEIEEMRVIDLKKEVLRLRDFIHSKAAELESYFSNNF